MPYFGIFDFYNISILMSLIVGMLYLFSKDRPYKNAHYLILTILLLATILEAYGTYSAYNNIRNTLYYNIFFVLVETNLIFIYFILISENKKSKKIILMNITMFSAWYLINTLIFQNIITQFQTYSYLLGGIMICIWCGNFFYEIFTFQRYPDGDLLIIPHFWIITGIFFFYAVSFMYFISLQLPDLDKNFIDMLQPIVRITSVLMYLLMGLAFHFPRIKNKPYLFAK